MPVWPRHVEKNYRIRPITITLAVLVLKFHLHRILQHHGLSTGITLASRGNFGHRLIFTECDCIVFN